MLVLVFVVTAASGSVFAVVFVSLCYESLEWLRNPWFAIPFFCKLVSDVLFNACDGSLFESGPKIIHTACHNHVLNITREPSDF